MKKNSVFLFALVVFCLLLVSGAASAQRSTTTSHQAQAMSLIGTAFTYQGRLTDGSSPANGTYDFRFKLYDAASGGSPVGSTVTKGDVPVSDGLFTVELDFGDVFDGTALWLNVEVRPGSSTGAYTTLSPRQSLTPAPFALGLRLPFDETASSNGPAFRVSNTGTGGGLEVVSSESSAVYGLASSSSGGSAYGLYGQSDSTSGRGVYGTTTATSGTNYGVYGRSPSTSGVGVYGYAEAASGTNYGVIGISHSPDGIGVYAANDGSDSAPDLVLGGAYGSIDNGNLFSDPDLVGSDLLFYSNDEVWVYLDNNDDETGSFQIRVGGGASNPVFKVNESGDVFADGTYNSPAADFAEMLPAEPDLEPGDVLVIGLDGRLNRSTEPYQTSLVGVYSTRPGYLGGGQHLGQKGFAPLAVVGVVPVKLSAENGPIQPGDLLTTSSTPGHAMKASPITENGISVIPSGVVIGKALEGLEAGTGMILMLVMLQ